MTQSNDTTRVFIPLAQRRQNGRARIYLSTILDDFSRYIVAWKLCTTMRASDVTDKLTMALEASGVDSMNVVHRPRLLTGNGSSYIAGDLADWLKEKGMDHVRGATPHPQTQG